MANHQDGRPARLELVREDDADCPVCGLGGAFAAARGYDVCARCGWVHDPAAYDVSEAARAWPLRLALRFSEGPLSTFAVTIRADEVGGYDYLIDGVSVRALFPSGVWNLKASVGPWPAAGDWFGRLRSGMANTPTRRSRLYVCPLCGGDDYEASITADVHVRADRVIWSRIGLETYDYSTDGWDLDLRHGPAGFAFDAEEYRRALVDPDSLR